MNARWREIVRVWGAMCYGATVAAAQESAVGLDEWDMYYLRQHDAAKKQAHTCPEPPEYWLRNWLCGELAALAKRATMHGGDAEALAELRRDWPAWRVHPESGGCEDDRRLAADLVRAEMHQQIRCALSQRPGSSE